MPFSSKIILDSRSPENYRLTTFQVRYPRIIHAEVMTYRMFSRNASSSRAVPTRHLIAEARDPRLRAEPIFWGKNKKGMQSVEEMDDKEKAETQADWEEAALRAADIAERMMNRGTYKGIVNRILEPFTHINVVVSATDFMNYFGQRLHRDAVHEIQHLAQLMFTDYVNSTPQLLQPGEWHLPYIRPADVEGRGLLELRKISTARCARTSFLSFDTGRTSEAAEDEGLHDRLVESVPLHASPSEHQATPDIMYPDGTWAKPKEHGNFTGFRQYRKMIPGEACAPLPDDFLERWQQYLHADDDPDAPEHPDEHLVGSGPNA